MLLNVDYIRLRLDLDLSGLGSNGSWSCFQGELSPPLLIELPLRCLVLCAQVHAGMWRRNGFSLINQVLDPDWTGTRPGLDRN